MSKIREEPGTKDILGMLLDKLPVVIDAKACLLKHLFMGRSVNESRCSTPTRNIEVDRTCHWEDDVPL